MSESQYFNREFEQLPKAFKEDLRTLEEEGNIYAQFWYDELDEFKYCRVPFKPAEIVEYVDSITAYDEFLHFRAQGCDDEEALDRISSDKIKTRVRERAERARERGQPAFVPAQFYTGELESLVCGLRKERYELVDEGFEGQEREILRQIINSAHLSVRALQDRRGGRPDFAIEEERDIHDLLYALLKPVFPESRVEEYTEKHAEKSKKIDIIVPEISTGIEVKYTHSPSQARDLGDELKIDIESYHVHENCNNMIAVIWDSERHIEDRHNFKNDLEGERSYGGRTFPVEVEFLG